MGERSKIEWTDHTWNLWEGCTKYSPGCEHCYAERDRDHRLEIVQWGPSGTRKVMTDGVIRAPLRWDSEIHKSSVPNRRERVFTMSLGDFFEEWDGPVINHKGSEARVREDGALVYALDRGRPATFNDLRAIAFKIMESTKNLDYLLLTKRPKNVARMVPKHWMEGHWPSHVWMGVSAEDQNWFDKRIDTLLEIPAAIRFLSCEPLLGSIRLPKKLEGIHWIIAGGESGPKSRPMHPSWPTFLRDQCKEQGIAFHFKQWGDWLPFSHWNEQMQPVSKESPSQYQQILIPETHLHGTTQGVVSSYRVGKAKAGRKLWGREHNELPYRLLLDVALKESSR